MSKVLPSLAYCEHCEEQFTDPDDALMCICYDCWKKVKSDGIREGLKRAAYHDSDLHCTDFAADCDRLKKENEQLKDRIARALMERDGVVRWNDEIQKENELLKAEVLKAGMTYIKLTEDLEKYQRREDSHMKQIEKMQRVVDAAELFLEPNGGHFTLNYDRRYNLLQALQDIKDTPVETEDEFQERINGLSENGDE